MSFTKREFEAGFEYGEEIEAGGASVPQGIPPAQAHPEREESLELAHAGSDSN